MEIMNLFPTPIGVKYYNPEDVSKLIEPFFKELKDPINAKKSAFNILDREGETVNNILKRMRKDVNEYARLIEANCNFDVDSSWIFINEQLGAHHHSIVPIVSCLYLDADDGTVGDDIGRIKFLDPRNGVNLYIKQPYYTDEENKPLIGKHPGGKASSNYFAGSSEFPITPKTGMMLIFPGYLAHYVDRNISNKNRILVGVNWERKLDLDKMDPSKRTPKATPLDMHNVDWQYSGLFKYIEKNYK
jgi:hypothetical protein